jgi:KDO2-lipid IV(A) lauroyltransferase
MYYIIFGFFYLLSLLPLPVLYLFSDFVYFLIYHVFGYRKKVVMHNLSIAFPDRTENEKTQIAKKFYRNFTDNFIETIKFLSAGENFFRKRLTGEFSRFADLYNRGFKVQIHLGHNFNWELANLALPLLTPYTVLTVYMPINNKAIDRLFLKIRRKMGSVLLPATDLGNAIAPYRNERYIINLVADQNPANPKNAYWYLFFGRPVPFLRGPERAAKRVNPAVVFAYITKKKRGYYEAHYEIATEDPKSLAESELTGMYVAYLERVVRQNPEMWLWSHRRWKWEWKPEYGPINEIKKAGV